MPTKRAALSSIPCLVSLLAAQDFRELGTGGLVPWSGKDWRSVAAGDIDGDGDRDLVFACFGEPGVGQRNFWLRNDGSGVFDATPANGVQLAPSLSRVVLLADFDGDGDLDAYFGNQRFDSLCRNDGNGHLVLDPAALPALDRETNAAARLDLDGDGDGDLDIIAACGGYDLVYLNAGNGTFTDGSARLPANWDYTLDLDVGDYDGDGDADLLFVNQDVPSRLLLNDGTGHFTASTVTFGTGSWVTGGDIDGDGDRDFVLGTVDLPFWYRGTVLHRNQGGGVFQVQALTFATQTERKGRLVDVDGDGDLDLTLATDRVRFNDGTGTFTDGPQQISLGSHFADIDGDGDLDQIGEPTLRNDGTGMFVWSQDIAVRPQDQGPALALVDFDNDGDPDLLRRGWNVVTVLGNDGRGVFRSVLAQATNGNWGNQPWLVTDLDGDGFDDLLQRFGNEWFRNLGGTGLQPQTLPEWLYDTLPFDGDGDGDSDLVGRNWLGVPLWLRNTGGTFTTVYSIPSTAISGVQATADCDGDGRDDVVWTAYPSGALRLWRVTGNGVFTSVLNAFPAALPTVTAAAVGDFDGDGDSDVVAGHDGNGPRLTLLANGGSGQFTIAAQPGLAIGWVSSFAIVDLDDDGDLDMVVRGGYVDAPRLLRNDGAFTFVDATGAGVEWRGLALPIGADAMVADVDRDGDVDVVPFGPATTHVLRNLQRQVAARSDPRRGASWRLEVLQRPVGQSLGSVVLGLAEASPAVPTPFGDLRIDPAGAVLQGLAIVDTFAPVEVLALPIPNTPALAGIAVFAQHVAFDGTSVRLGNQLRGVVQ
jgi:hypothetical protein